MSKYFGYCPDAGFETFETEDEAKEFAQDSIDCHRDHSEEGWDDAVSEVCWGGIKQQSTQTDLQPLTDDLRTDKGMWDSPCDTYCDYELK